MKKLIKLKKLNNRGLTLTEVMVSVTIFAILIAPIVTQLNSLMKQNYKVKVSQAETDYASRIMEQFKAASEEDLQQQTDDEGNPLNNLANNGFELDNTSYPNVSIYSMSGVQLEKDLDASATSVNRNGTTYKVEVSLDSAAYAASSGTNAAEYKDPNDTVNYNLANVDENTSVLIKEAVANYDSRAASDLLDKYLEKLKAEDPGKYNRYLSGADNLLGLAYGKNTHIKVKKGTSGGKKCYFVTVTLSYKENYYNQTVEYTLMKDKEYLASKTGNKPPAIYFFYNQFVQENMLIDGSDTVTIDNSECGTTKNDTIKLYMIKGETENSGTYTYYVRKPDQEPQTVQGQATMNTAGSYVYKIQTADGTKYKWPSFVTNKRDDAKYGSTPAEINITDDTLDVVHPVENAADGDTTKWYVYNDVLIDEMPSSVYYEERTGKGSYTYIRKDDGVDLTGGTSKRMYKGDIVFQRETYGYVWPDGTVSNQAPDIEHYYIGTPSEKDFDSTVKVNVLLAKGSALTNGRTKLIDVYTNIPTANFMTSLSPVTFAGTTNLTYPATDYSTIPLSGSDFTDFFQPLTEDKSDGDDQLRHIIVKLYRVDEDGTESNILTLESGKEG